MFLQLWRAICFGLLLLEKNRTSPSFDNKTPESGLFSSFFHTSYCMHAIKVFYKALT